MAAASEEIYRGKLISLRIETLPKPSGGTTRFEIIEHPGGIGIVALRENPLAGAGAEPEVVLVAQYRPALGKSLWEIPAGLVEEYERDQPELTAERELREETGHTADSWQLLTRVYPSVGFSTETQTLFLARHAYPAPDAAGIPDDPTEIEQVRWLPLSEALDWCKRGLIVDSKTVLGLYLTHHLLSTGS
jgi:8-oxo-dGTP pyrophosphatase MutT (NUDIX family)